MLLSSCEITHRVVRGHVVVSIFGDRRLDAADLTSLRQQYEEAHGPGVLPCYVSPEGWQALDAAPEPAPAADPAPAPAPEAPPPPAAPAPAARKKAQA